MVGVCGQFQLQNARESRPIRLSEEPRPFFFMGVPSLFCSSQGLSCNCLFKDNNKGRLSEELCTAISSLEASTATTAQCDGGVESRGKEGEERRKRETDWVVIKGLFFLPTGEHLHSSHLLRGDWATVHVCSHSHVQLAPFFERLASAAGPFPPRGSLTVPAKSAQV